MKKKLIDFLICLLYFLILILIFKHNKEIAKIIIQATNIFFKKVFVSLFPMFILNDLLLISPIPYYFYYLFNKTFQKLFKLNGLASYIFLMSLISGTPSSTLLLKNLVDNNKITSPEASYYLYFTYFSNPLFLTVMLNNLFNGIITLKIIVIHYLSNIIIAFLIRKNAPKNSCTTFNYEHKKISDVLITSIKKSMNTLLMILGTITFYMIISFLILQYLPQNNILKSLIKGLLEITNGLNSLTLLNITPKIKEIIAITIISFGGLSIHTQVKGVLEDTKIKYKCFLFGRIYQTLLSIILVIIF